MIAYPLWHLDGIFLCPLVASTENYTFAPSFDTLPIMVVVIYLVNYIDERRVLHTLWVDSMCCLKVVTSATRATGWLEDLFRTISVKQPRTVTRQRQELMSIFGNFDAVLYHPYMLE